MRYLLLLPKLELLMVSNVYYCASPLTARKPKVGYLDCRAANLNIQHHDDVCRLDVAVDLAAAIDVRQAAGRILEDHAQTNGKLGRPDR